MSQGPLHGIRVVDLTSIISGPVTTMVAYLWPEGMAGYTFIGREVKAARAGGGQNPSTAARRSI